MIYGHAGDLGDLVYHLLAMQLHSQSPFELVLFDAPMTNHRMTQDKVYNIESFFSPNIITFSKIPIDSPINNFRNYHAKTISGMGLIALGYNEDDHIHKTWLNFEKTNCDILINRTFRYNGFLNYQELLNEFHKQCSFVGTINEYNKFVKDFGYKIYFHRTPELLDVAKLVSGCKVFVGNQSSAMAMAIGLGKVFVQEVSEKVPNCIFPRPDCLYSYDMSPINDFIRKALAYKHVKNTF